MGRNARGDEEAAHIWPILGFWGRFVSQRKEIRAHGHYFARRDEGTRRFTKERRFIGKILAREIHIEKEFLREREDVGGRARIAGSFVSEFGSPRRAWGD